MSVYKKLLPPVTGRWASRADTVQDGPLGVMALLWYRQDRRASQTSWKHEDSGLWAEASGAAWAPGTHTVGHCPSCECPEMVGRRGHVPPRNLELLWDQGRWHIVLGFE